MDDKAFKIRHLPFLLNRTVIVYFTVLTSIVGAANNTQGPQLEVLYVTPFKGFIQTPGFDGVKPHPQNMDSWVRVDVPQNHTVMLNIRDIDLTLKPYDSVCDWRLVQLTVYKRTMSDEDIIFKCVNPFGYWPELYPHMEVFYVHFVSKDVKPKTGFRISFSFHNESFLPEIAGHDYMWIFNCSVPHYKDFEHHFTCNLKDDCIAREDEEFCSYRSDMCGPGLISVSGMCMSFERANTSKFSWNDAYASCLKKGGRLAVLNTPEIWTAAADLLEKTAYYYKMFYQIIVGLRSASPSLPFMYRNEFQWTDGTIAYYRAIRNINIWPSCFVLSAQNYKNRMDMKPCGKNAPYSNYMCSMDQDSTGEGASDLSTPEIQMSTDNSNEYKQVRCPSGHMTHDFLACDVKSACWERESSCEVPLSPLPPTFMCDNQVERVPYTLVCDFRADCSDDSDEEFCVYQQCAEKEPFYCNDKQCVSVTVVCDGQQQCMNGADEDLCSAYSFGVFRNPPPPALVNLENNKGFTVRSFSTTDLQATPLCPDTHYQCPGDGYCLPVFTRCNGVYDCPGKEDEAGCNSYTCPGFYRCRSSQVCVHPSQVCDGLLQCPQHDDELLCGFKCPGNCTCYGMSFFCTGPFPVDEYTGLRYLHARGTGMTLGDLANNTLLIHINLADCDLYDLDMAIHPNLVSLDVSDNRLTHVHMDHIMSFPQLRNISLAGNPLTSLFLTEDPNLVTVLTLKTLDLSRVEMREINVNMLYVFPNLESLNLSHSGVDRVHGEGLRQLKQLTVLELRGNPMTSFPNGLFDELNNLETLYADNYKFCCPAILPVGFILENCHAPSDEISSCDALLRSDVYRAVLSVFAVLTLLGNCGSYVFRVFWHRNKSPLGFDMFVTHLSVSDFLMGVYLAIIGVVDRLYQGTYVWEDVAWRNSVMCQIAGFLSLLSSEVSAFIICLITLDRFLVLRFPFSSLRFQRRSANIACVVVWVIGLVLVTVPLLPMTSHWEFYGQTGICIPLPVTRTSFAGHDYAFGVMIGLNFVLFMLIAAGQIFIYWSIHVNTMSASDSTKKSKDLTIARRLITIAVSDFLCWFPIGLLGLMASNGTPIPGEVNVAMAIIVLPLNSALNPFLYTVNVVVERQRRISEERLKKRILSELASQFGMETFKGKSTEVTREN